MDQNIIIYVGVYKALALLGSVIASTVYGTWTAASRLARLEARVDSYEGRLTNLEGRLDGVFAGRSPIALLERGQHFLEDSGLKRYVDRVADELIGGGPSAGLVSNPYDIQNAAFRLMDEHDFGHFEPNLKAAAFRYGLSIQMARRIAGIYLRDVWLSNA